MKLPLLALLLALPVLAQQDNLQVSAPSLVRPGQVLDLTIRRTSTPLPAASSGVQLTLTFSGQVTAISVDGAPTGKTPVCHLTSSTAAICLESGLNTTIIPDGVVMVVHATLAPSQNPNFTITNSVTPNGSAAPNGDSLQVIVNPTVSVSVQSSQCDIDGDGQITPVDVKIVTDQAVKITAWTGAADMNKDGLVDVRDVQWVAAALNGGVCR